MALSIINFSCPCFFIDWDAYDSTSLSIFTPLLALNLTLLASLKQHKKIIHHYYYYTFLSRVHSVIGEPFLNTKPYVTDIGYSDEFTNYFANNCNSDSTAYILNTDGLFHFFKSSKIFIKKFCAN